MNIKSVRKRCGLSQANLAKKLGIDQSTISLWENGKTHPRVNLLPKLAVILECTIDELLVHEQPNTIAKKSVSIDPPLQNGKGDV